MDFKQHNYFKKKLNSLLLSEEELSEIIKQADQSIELDQSRMGRLSRMDALQAQQIEQETTRRRIQYNQLVKKALVRIESEDYGYCEICDEEINILRLEADPVNYLCINCAD